MSKKNLLLLGGSGLIGSALLKELNNVSDWTVTAPTSKELDLRDGIAVANFFKTHRPNLVINAAGKSGGVLANKKYPADFILENTQMQTHLLQESLKNQVERFIQFIPACIYPTTASLPYKESSILTGPLEESSQYFAVAKINALMMAQAFNRQHGTQFISVIPSNVYGISPKTASDNSHVIPSLFMKMTDAIRSTAAQVEIWGNGNNRRDYLHAKDLALATLLVLRHNNPPEVLNIGSGTLTSVKELSECIQELTGYKGQLQFSDNGLSGAQDKFLDSSEMTSLGWKAQIDLRTGLSELAKTLKS